MFWLFLLFIFNFVSGNPHQHAQAKPEKLLKVSDNQLIHVTGTGENMDIVWSKLPDKAREYVYANLKNKIEYPYTINLGRVHHAFEVKKLLESTNLATDVKNLFLNRTDEDILYILKDLETIGAQDLQIKISQELANLDEYQEKFDGLLSSTPSGQIVRLTHPTETCKNNCNFSYTKTCLEGYKLVNAGSEFFGKCRKLVDLIGDRCPEGTKIIHSLSERLTCVQILEPNQCLQGFEESDNNLKCKQVKSCKSKEEIIKTGPNIGWCKKVKPTSSSASPLKLHP